MFKGGYKIIDLKGVTIDDESGATISGLYDQIEGATKPILLAGVNNDGVDIAPTFATFSPVANGSATDFVCVLAQKYSGTSVDATIMTVDDDDKVTISTVTVS